MAVRNIKNIRPHVWVLPRSTAEWKITVERSDGSIDDITQTIIFFSLEDGVTDNFGQFEFKIDNSDEAYTSAWTGGEIVRYYSDYATTATTIRFKGEIEKPSKRSNNIVVKGRSRALRFANITVTKSFSNTETSAILASIINSYGQGVFTTTNISASTTSLTVNWVQKPFFDCVNELATAAGFDFYIDASDDWHYFSSGSITNTTDAFVHDSNINEVGEFTPDLSQQRNRVIVYGAEQEGTQIIYTKEDTAGIAAGDAIKEHIITDDSITSRTSAKDRAEFEYAKLQELPIIGEVKGELLATIQPGEKLRVSDPPNGIAPAAYRMVSYKHSIDTEGLIETSVKLNKQYKATSQVLKSIIQANNQQQSVSLNPEEMRFAQNYLFDDDSGSHTNTEITSGNLRPTAGTGTWTSNTTSLDEGQSLSEVYIVASGNLTGVTFSVSGDGITFESVSRKTKTNLVNVQGANLKVRVTFANANGYVASLGVLYNVS